MKLPLQASALEHRSTPLPFDLSRLGEHLAAAGLELDASFVPRRMRGGLANVNYIARIDDDWAVLRCAPQGDLPKGAHDRVREHRVLSRLPDAFDLAPRSLHLCEDKGVIGAQFQILEFRSGQGLDENDLLALGRERPIGPAVADVMIDVMASLHAVDPSRVGLSALGSPDGFLDRAIAGWTARGIEAAKAPDVAEMISRLGRWLESRASAMPANAPTLLHCDFKLDNILFAPGSLQPVAVLDWDMCTRGEPLFDLATLLSYWTEPGDPDCMHRLRQMPTTSHGFPSRAEIVQSYTEKTGRSVTGFSHLWTLCVMKLGVVFLQLGARWAGGAMGHQDGRQDFETLGGEILRFAHSQINHHPAGSSN